MRELPLPGAEESADQVSEDEGCASGAASDGESDATEGSVQEELPCFTRLATEWLVSAGHPGDMLLSLPLSKIDLELPVQLFDARTRSFSRKHLVIATNVVFLFDDDSKEIPSHVFHLLEEYFSVCIVKYDSKYCVKLLQDGGGIDEHDSEFEEGRLLSTR